MARRLARQGVCSDVVGERLDFLIFAGSRTFAAMVASLGELDTLVNNAAVLYCDPLDEIPDQHRREILAVNSKAPAALIAAVAPGMKTRREGRIVNVSSVAAFTGHPDLWYGVTKGRVTESDESLGARTPGPFGVLAVKCGSSRADADAHALNQLPQSRRDEVIHAVYSGREGGPRKSLQPSFASGAPARNT